MQTGVFKKSSEEQYVRFRKPTGFQKLQQLPAVGMGLLPSCHRRGFVTLLIVATYCDKICSQVTFHYTKRQMAAYSQYF